ncbi:DUF3265 domain-containing protein [Vibrio gallaecicus]|nr:DUF3265 domain-containing protein [Vibrio gallaecicus]MDN3617438.1 DUF3265 domain-containing protein [Vibrio gallaecicus]
MIKVVCGGIGIACLTP